MKNKLLIKASMKGDPGKKKKEGSGNKQYGIYTEIMTEKGSKDNPTEEESVKNMVNYMKNNNPPQSSNPSNVYRQQFTHHGVTYDRKKKQTDA